jgi:hypothetical protein
VVDDFAKEYLHGELRETREAMLWKLDGLSEYDVRRPLTPTGTNLLGLVKHLSIWEHSDATITALAIDSPGYVPWWPQPDVKLFNIVVHMLTETSRHAGHADILREHLDGSTGTAAEHANRQRDAAFWQARRAKIERAAKAAGQIRA